MAQQINIDAVRKALNMPNLTDNAIREALRGAGVTTNAQAGAWAQKNAAPSQGSFWSRGFGGLEQAAKGHAFAPGQPMSRIANWLVQGTPFQPKAAPPAPAKPKAKAAAAKPDPAAQAAAMEKAIANSPWNQMMQAVEKTYAAEEAPVQAAISGAGTVPGQNQAINMALGLTGAGQAGAAFLGNAQAQANAATAPVTAAMRAMGTQFAANQGPISNALAAYANANALMTETAPASAWLSALQSHITSNLSYYGEVPKAAVGSIPPAVASALSQSGGYPGSATTGLVPLSSLTPNAAGGVGVAPGATSAGLPGATGGLTIPSTGSVAPGQ